MTSRAFCPRYLRGFLCLCALALGTAPWILAASTPGWMNWRGPNGNGSAETGNYPVQWDEATNLLWKVPLPGKGCSTPAVCAKRIFVTAPAEGQDAVLAFDWNGKELWRTKLGAERAGKHRNGSGSNASPTTDGQNVFVYFKSGNFAALEFDGKVRWQTNLVEAFGRDTLYWDHGTSPILTKSSVVMTRMHHGESWLAAFDKKTGALQWKVARNYETPAENDHGYSTPQLIRYQNREALLLWGGEKLTIHDAADGKLLWTAGNFNPTAGQNWPSVATPVVVGDIAVVPFGRSDRGNPLLYGVRLGAAAGELATNHLWQRSDTGTFVPSPCVWQEKVYLVRDRGEVECLDPLTGKTVWSGAFPKSSVNFYSSPTISDGRLYAAREDGSVFVARVSTKFELLAENPMGESLIATPVLLDGRILIRGAKNLYCLGSP